VSSIWHACILLLLGVSSEQHLQDPNVSLNTRWLLEAEREGGREGGRWRRGGGGLGGLGGGGGERERLGGGQRDRETQRVGRGRREIERTRDGEEDWLRGVRTYTLYAALSLRLLRQHIPTRKAVS
jgi:hypothetical protein